MKFKYLCEIQMQYEGDSAWIRPYELGDVRQGEGSGYGSGHGKVLEDKISGSLVWANHPRRREDGVWCPNLTGFISTEEGGEKILVEIKGYSIREKTSGLQACDCCFNDLPV